MVSEAEQAGTRGDVDQAQDLMTMCDSLKVERDNLLKNGLLHEGGGGHRTSESSNNPHWTELAQAQEKQMEVCEVCGAFLIVGDAQQRIEDHLTGKQHLGLVTTRIRTLLTFQIFDICLNFKVQTWNLSNNWNEFEYFTDT